MNRQRGAALMVVLLVLGVIGVFFAVKALNAGRLEGDRKTALVLVQAKEALIGRAATNITNGLLGYLPGPDLGLNNSVLGEGNASGNFTGNATNLSVVGRLPWRTLGHPPLRDAFGECLWYARSGSINGDAPPNAFNWDSIGHFEVFSSDGTPGGTVSTTGTNLHNRPIALIFSAGPILPGQSRVVGPDPVGECGGNYNVRNYLDTLTPNPNISGIQNHFSPSPSPSWGFAYNLNSSSNASVLDTAQLPYAKKIISGRVDIGGNRIVNDQVLGITATEIFDRVKRRQDFINSVTQMITDVADCLSGLASPTQATNKGLGANCLSTAPGEFRTHWQDNLLYARPPVPFIVNGNPSCDAVLFFAGERRAGQTRVTPAQKGSNTTQGDPAMYLEGDATIDNPLLFATTLPVGKSALNFVGGATFTAENPSRDVVRCINFTAPGATFTDNFSSFTPVGNGVSPNATNRTVSFTSTSGGAGCFWYQEAFLLAKRTVRGVYDFQFFMSDLSAIGGPGQDRGNGFTFQMVNGSLPTAPNVCGNANRLGALSSSNEWGYLSFIFETDVSEDNSNHDPAENHSAIMLNGNLDHPSGTLSNACNGTAAECRHSPANKFEESPLQEHKQRIELVSGCNAGCGTCDPASHAAPNNNYVRIKSWIDCVNCDDVSKDYGELISTSANRDFSAPGYWMGTNWSVANGALTHAPGPFAVSLPNAALIGPPVPSASYRITFKTSTASPGTLSISFGGVTGPTMNLIAGTVTQTLQVKAISTAPLVLTPNAGWSGAIDDVSIVALPTIQRCVQPASDLDTFYFGFTGGFSGASNKEQGVIIKRFHLRSE